MIQTKTGLINENVWDDLKKFGDDDNIIRHLKKLFKKKQQLKTQPIIPDQDISKTPTVTGGVSKDTPTTISPTTKPVVQPKTNYGASPVSNKTSQQTDDGDPFHTTTGRIQTTEPSLRMMPQQSLKMSPQQSTGLKMAPQQPLPQQAQQPQAVPQQPAQQVQQPAAAPQQRNITPQGAAALRQFPLGRPKSMVPRGKVKAYEETITEEQLKAIIKEVAKVLKK